MRKELLYTIIGLLLFIVGFLMSYIWFQTETVEPEHTDDVVTVIDATEEEVASEVTEPVLNTEPLVPEVAVTLVQKDPVPAGIVELSIPDAEGTFVAGIEVTIGEYTYKNLLYFRQNSRQDLIKTKVGEDIGIVYYKNIDALSAKNLFITGKIEGTTYLLMAQGFDGTENDYMPLIRFDVDTSEYIELPGKEFITPFEGKTADFGRQIISPNGAHILWVPQPLDNTKAPNMYLIDTIAGTYELVISLDAVENFNGGTSGLDARYDISWLDDTTIRYAVFDQAETLLEYREYTIE